jgi:hypothetical protein
MAVVHGMASICDDAQAQLLFRVLTSSRLCSACSYIDSFSYSTQQPQPTLSAVPPLINQQHHWLVALQGEEAQRKEAQGEEKKDAAARIRKER